jgi:hypothetical protein
VVSGLEKARPGGRVITYNGNILRFAQDNYTYYGRQLRVFEIYNLTTKDYKEKELMMQPVLKDSGCGWNSIGMHHIDAHYLSEDRWIACVDGLTTKWKLGIK